MVGAQDKDDGDKVARALQTRFPGISVRCELTLNTEEGGGDGLAARSVAKRWRSFGRTERASGRPVAVSVLRRLSNGGGWAVCAHPRWQTELDQPRCAAVEHRWCWCRRWISRRRIAPAWCVRSYRAQVCPTATAARTRTSPHGSRGPREHRGGARGRGDGPARRVLHRAVRYAQASRVRSFAWRCRRSRRMARSRAAICS